jgi:hypothetical protein
MRSWVCGPRETLRLAPLKGPRTKESPSLLGQKALLVYLSNRAIQEFCVPGFYPTIPCYAI